MKSLDTNLLVYAANLAAAEQPKAQALVEAMLAAPREWILADQMLFEFYKALRNPRLFERPIPADDAAKRIHYLREEAGVAHCGYSQRLFSTILAHLEDPAFPYQRTHDTILATTLRYHSVTTFYTRNTKDFADAGFTEVINPID